VCRVLWRLYSIKQESVYVIRDMGIQLNRRRFIGFQSCRFIEKSKISAVVINEGITCGDIIFYLAILIRGQNKMVLVFERFLPRLKILQEIYVGIRTILFDDELHEEVMNSAI
jgi:hypothetical protein